MLVTASEVIWPFVGTAAVVAAGIVVAKNLRKTKTVDTGGNVVEGMINRQGWNEKLVPDDLDVVIIGSGLTCAAILAKAGKKVLVLEQHYIAGGNCHTFSEKGYEFDTGLHYLGGKLGQEGAFSPLKKLMEYVTDNGVEWEKMDECYDVAVFGSGAEREEFPVHENIKTHIADLKRKFPEDVDGIDKYFRVIRKLQLQVSCQVASLMLPRWLSSLLRPISAYFLSLFQKTALEVISALTSNKKLIAVLTYIWGDYGERPGRGAFAMHGLLVDHFKGGGYYPKGGPETIPRRMIRVIERGGGKVMVRAPVSEILIDDNGVACGVCVKDVNVYARKVVSSVGAPNTFKKLLPEAFRPLVLPLSPRLRTANCDLRPANCELRDGRRLRELQATCAMPGADMMLRGGGAARFVGIKDENNELKLPSHNIWKFPGNYDHDANAENFRKDPTAPFPAVFISFCSAKDPTYKDRCPGKQAALVIAPTCYDQVEAWKDERCMHRGKDYQAVKDELKARMLASFLEEYPHLKDKIDFVDVGTPVTNDFYLGNYRGACYGLAHTPERFQAPWLRPQTPIRNLYLTGQDVLFVGIASAVMSGFLTVGVLDLPLFFRVGAPLLLR